MLNINRTWNNSNIYRKPITDVQQLICLNPNIVTNRFKKKKNPKPKPSNLPNSSQPSNNSRKEHHSNPALTTHKNRQQRL